MLELVTGTPLRLQMQRMLLDSVLREHFDREIKEMEHPHLDVDADALFARTRAGHMLRHVFNDASMPYFERFMRENPNYLAQEEIETINAHLDYISELGTNLRAQTADKDSEVVVEEWGTGNDHSQTFKTIPTLRAIRPDGYVGVDFAPASAAGSMINVWNAFKKAADPDSAIKVQMRIKDFIRDDLRIESKGPRALLIYGNTLANLEGFSDALPQAEMDVVLTKAYNHVGRGGYVLIGLQHQMQEDTSYQDKRFHAFHQHFLKVLKKGLHKDSGFKPEDFEFFVRWEPAVANHVFGYRAKRPGWVQPMRSGERRYYSQGDEFITCNSWRFSPDFLRKSFVRNGFTPLRTMTKPGGQMTIHALQAH